MILARWRRFAYLSIAAITALLITWSTVEPIIRQPSFIAYCEAGHWPHTWQTGAPRWATDARLDALCAMGAWMRAEFGIPEAAD